MKIHYKTVSQIDHVATGEAVKKERKKAGKSLRVVAAAAGISAPYLLDLERGYRSWTEDLFKKISKAVQ